MLKESVILLAWRNQVESRASERRWNMGLFKRGQTWWMSFTYRGRQVRKSTETSNKKLAEKIYHKVLGEIAERRWFEKLPGEEKPFTEMIAKYLKEHSARNKTPKSHDRDRQLANHLIRFFGDSMLTEITPRSISEYKVRRRDEGASPRTINYELALMSHAFNIAIKEWEWLKDNPVRKVSRERVNNIIERWMTYEEEQKLLNASIEWVQPILILGIETGLRQDELLNLRWSNVDLFRKTLTILEQKNKGKDTLPLSEKAIEVLKARAKVRSIHNDLVFFNRNGNRIDARNLLRAFYSAIKKAKIENLRWHDATRHTFATRLIQAGVDLYTVQKLGRWKTTQMVMRYAHHYPESLRRGVEILDKVRKEFSTNLAQSNEKGVNQNG
jgi:integrase